MPIIDEKLSIFSESKFGLKKRELLTQEDTAEGTDSDSDIPGGVVDGEAQVVDGEDDHREPAHSETVHVEAPSIPETTAVNVVHQSQQGPPIVHKFKKRKISLKVKGPAKFQVRLETLNP